MSSTSLDLSFRCTGREVFTAAEAPAAGTEQQRTLQTGTNGFSKTLNGSSTPKLDQPLISREITLGGATTLDLAAIAALALPSAATRTVDLTGKKLKAVLLRSKSTNNAAGINIAPGAANPYPMFGAGNDITLYPDAELMMAFRATEPPAGIPAVAAGAKEIDLTPGAAGDVLYIELYFGT